MFHKIFKKQFIIELHSSASFSKERQVYLDYWQKHGAPLLSLQRIADMLLIIVNNLNLDTKKLITAKKIDKTFAQLTCQARNHKKGEFLSSVTKNACASHAKRWLEMIGLLSKEVKIDYPFSKQLFFFENYLQKEKGLAKNTINKNSSVLKSFFKYIAKKRHFLSDLSARDIDNFFIYKANSYSRHTIQERTSIIRSFLKYAEVQKWCKQGLSASIRCPRIYKHENLPFGPSWDDVRRLLDTTKSDHPVTIRDRAILMLLAVYGLRCKEVTNLQLDDLDWEHEFIYINRAKSAKSQVFPLSKIVGDSILNYLKKVRIKKCLYRKIFLRIKAPYKPLTPAAISIIANKYLKPLNLPIQHHGAHALRHACATRLMNEKNISLKEISEYLGHKDLETTRIYAKVDIANLRKVADFDMGGVL